MNGTTYCLKTSTPLGEMLLAEKNNALIGAWFLGQKYFPLPAEWIEDANALLKRAAEELDRYFNRNLKVFSVPLAPQGTTFQKRVWQQITAIPHGKTLSYGEIAQALSSSARPVGTATGRNPLSLFIPCHRVIGKNGSLTGYAGGLEKKKYLLELEEISYKH